MLLLLLFLKSGSLDDLDVTFFYGFTCRAQMLDPSSGY